MKKIFFIAALCISFVTLFAQEPADALRYSWTNPNGTARTQSVGGAIGALGGDVTSAFVNPAGLGMYKTGDFVMTPGFGFLNNKSTYYGTTESQKKNQFAFGTTGFVIGFGSNANNNRKLKGSSFTMAINRIADFNSNILYRGQQNQSSYSQKFLEEIAGNKDANSVANNYPFGATLAFNTYWIDTIGGGTSGNYQFQTRAPIAKGLDQLNTINQKGGITELAIAGAANISDKVYYGVTLGIPFLNFKRTTEFIEAESSPNDPNNNFDYAAFSDNLSSRGVGLNLKAGVIYKATETLRLGLALHSPTFYSLEDKYTSSITTNTENYQGELTQNSTDFNNGEQAFKYTLFTPYKVIVSGAYVLGSVEDVTKQQGFITADIEYVNYKSMSYSTDPGNEVNDQSTKDYLKSLNQAIDNAYKGAINLRLGGELKFNTLMVRLGGAYYGNPYKNINGEKGSRTQITGGIGYRNKGMFIDLGYVHNIRKDVNFAYRLENKAIYKGADIKGMGGNVVVTVGFKI